MSAPNTPDERQPADLVREQTRTFSRAAGALQAVATSIKDGTANRLDPGKLNRLATDCLAARDEIQRLIDGEADA
jgi:hypothetical protein